MVCGRLGTTAVLVAVACARTDRPALPGPLEVEAHLEGTELVARARGRERRGRDFLGAELVAVTQSGAEALLRLESIERSERPGFDDVLRYVVTLEREGKREFLCGEDAAGRPIKAIPLEGRWEHASGTPDGGRWIADPDGVTFACEGAALAKCVYLGFKPWAGDVTHCPRPGRCRTASLAALHQACVRMMRADYCGDGAPHTLDGTRISYRDGFGFLGATEGWLHEAEWTADGARCVARVRVPALGEPACLGRLKVPDCGAEEHFDEGSLLMSGLPPTR